MAMVIGMMVIVGIIGGDGGVDADCDGNCYGDVDWQLLERHLSSRVCFATSSTVASASMKRGSQQMPAHACCKQKTAPEARSANGSSPKTRPSHTCVTMGTTQRTSAGNTGGRGPG